jgi:hypothetical protein
MDELPGSLASIRAKHTSWQIALENGVYVAVQRPAQNSTHLVYFASLKDLAKRLDELDQR